MNVQIVGKINIATYRCVSAEIVTDEVVMTEERIEHIRKQHPNDYERFCTYIPRMIAEPDYIVQANKANTAVILKEIEENGEKFKLILRIKMQHDPADYLNSVLSFSHLGDTTWRKTLKNKKILYKAE